MMIKKKKILHAIRQGKIGGGETHVLDLVQQLNKSQYESVVLAFTNGPLIDELQKLNIKTHVILTEKPFDFSVWGKVHSFIAQENFDIVHAHGTRAQSNVFWASRKLKVPIIYTVHGWSFHPNQNILVKKIRELSEKFLVNKAATTICVSVNNQKEGNDLFKMSRSVVIQNGINFSKFNASGNYANIRTEFNIDNHTILVGYIARITAQKDPLSFIKAIAEVPSHLPIKYLVIGEGELKEQTIKLAEKLNLTSKIIFSNFRQDIPSILYAIDIYCLPSLWEGLPIGLLEAMAMRKASIASAVNGTNEIIQNGINGELIKPGNITQLAEKITALATDSVYRIKIGDAAEKFVKQTYDIGLMTKKIEDLYQLILQMKAV